MLRLTFVVVLPACVDSPPGAGVPDAGQLNPDADVSGGAMDPTDAAPTAMDAEVGDAAVDVTAPTCAADSECDDGLHCTRDDCVAGMCTHSVAPASCGPGRHCAPAGNCIEGRVCAGDEDCVDDDPCTQGEMCNAATATCGWAPLDGDGDGHAPIVCGGDDPNDAEASVFPRAIEICDGQDNDQDDEIDEAAAVAADCENRGGGTCEGGYCNRCTASDMTWLTTWQQMGGNQPWVSLLLPCKSAVDPVACFERGLDPDLSPECAECFSSYYGKVADCPGSSLCVCAESLALDELRECANGHAWTCNNPQ